MGKVTMCKGNELIQVAKNDVATKKKEGYKITSKYAQKKTVKNISEEK